MEWMGGVSVCVCLRCVCIIKNGRGRKKKSNLQKGKCSTEQIFSLMFFFLIPPLSIFFFFRYFHFFSHLRVLHLLKIYICDKGMKFPSIFLLDVKMYLFIHRHSGKGEKKGRGWRKVWIIFLLHSPYFFIIFLCCVSPSVAHCNGKNERKGNRER